MDLAIADNTWYMYDAYLKYFHCYVGWVLFQAADMSFLAMKECNGVPARTIPLVIPRQVVIDSENVLNSSQ